MKRVPLLLLVLLAPAALAQMPTSTGSATATRSATSVQTPTVAPPPVRPADPLPAPPRPAALPAPRPLSSPPSVGPIRSESPATLPATPASTAPAKVYDREGRILPGVRPAGPNRVFDTRTGRYHDAVPNYGGQQVRP